LSYLQSCLAPLRAAIGGSVFRPTQEFEEEHKDEFFEKGYAGRDISSTPGFGSNANGNARAGCSRFRDYDGG